MQLRTHLKVALSLILALGTIRPLIAQCVSEIDTGLIGEVVGMDYADGVLWVSGQRLPVTVYKFDLCTGTPVGSVMSPVTTATGARDIVLSTESIFQSEDQPGSAHVHKWNKTTGVNIETFPHFGTFPQGIASDENFIYVVDIEGGGLQKRLIQSPDYPVAITYSLPDPVGAYKGMTYYSDFLYLINAGRPGFSAAVVEIDPDTGTATRLEVPDSIEVITAASNVIVVDIIFDGFYSWFLIRDPNDGDRVIRTPSIVRPPAIAVEIDVKPGSDPNIINPRSKGNVPVAIITTAIAEGESIDFDAWDVDSLTVKFGPDGAGITHSQGHAEDVDGDGDLDMVVHFRVQQTGIACGDTGVTLTAETFGGQQIEGTVSIDITGCK